jgi:hypothetical protein
MATAGPRASFGIAPTLRDPTCCPVTCLRLGRKHRSATPGCRAARWAYCLRRREFTTLLGRTYRTASMNRRGNFSITLPSERTG